MHFVQIIEFKTSKYDEINKLMDEWTATAAGKRTPTRSITLRDRDNPTTYYEVVEFPSYEEAMANSNLPETDQFAKRMEELCDGPATFHNLDLVRDDVYA